MDTEQMHFDDPIWAALFEYSEWLDVERLLDGPDEDDRSHAALVNTFLASLAEEK